METSTFRGADISGRRYGALVAGLHVLENLQYLLGYGQLKET